MTSNKLNFDEIFADFCENSLSNNHKEEKMSQLSAIAEEWFITNKPIFRKVVIEKLESLSNEILGTTF